MPRPPVDELRERMRRAEEGGGAERRTVQYHTTADRALCRTVPDHEPIPARDRQRPVERERHQCVCTRLDAR